MKIKVSDSIADDVAKLTKQRVLVLEDGARCRRIGQELAPLRANGSLLMGYDRKLRKSILVMNGHGTPKRRRKVGYRFDMWEF